jgi:hypothetical protein
MYYGIEHVSTLDELIPLPLATRYSDSESYRLTERVDRPLPDPGPDLRLIICRAGRQLLAPTVVMSTPVTRRLGQARTPVSTGRPSTCGCGRSAWPASTVTSFSCEHRTAS